RGALPAVPDPAPRGEVRPGEGSPGRGAAARLGRAGSPPGGCPGRSAGAGRPRDGRPATEGPGGGPRSRPADARGPLPGRPGGAELGPGRLLAVRLAGTLPRRLGPAPVAGRVTGPVREPRTGAGRLPARAGAAPGRTPGAAGRGVDRRR